MTLIPNDLKVINVSYPHKAVDLIYLAEQRTADEPETSLNPSGADNPVRKKSSYNSLRNIYYQDFTEFCLRI
jgi:hypothetical protein